MLRALHSLIQSHVLENERETGNAKRSEGGRSEPKRCTRLKRCERWPRLQRAQSSDQGANRSECVGALSRASRFVEVDVSSQPGGELEPLCAISDVQTCCPLAPITSKSLTTQMPKRQASDFTSTSQEVQTPTRSIDMHFSNELDEHTIALFGSR